MGKRKKASKPPPKKKREALGANFKCLFCNHEDSVNVKCDKKLGVGMLLCKVCGQSFQSTINYLSGPVDVYADWIDACDAVSKESQGNVARQDYRDYDAPARVAATPGGSAARRGARVGNDDDDDEEDDVDDDADGFIVNDEIDGEGEFADDD